MKQIILLYPTENDPQTIILYEEILNKGGKAHLEPFKIPDKKDGSSISFDGKNLKIGSNLYDNIGAVYLRNVAVDTPTNIPGYTNAFEHAVWRAKFIKENYKVSAISGILSVLQSKGVLIANPIDTYFHHNTKANFFIDLANRKYSVPNTFATNDMAYVSDSYEKRRLIMKSMSGVGATRIVKKEHLERARDLSECPALFQDKIEGYTARVHTVGNKAVLTLKILADDIDSRSDTAGFEVMELDKKAEKQIVEINKKIGLHFSAWDAIIDNNGDAFLLDCNSGPYIGWIGNYYMRLVQSELAKYLIAYADSGSIEIAENSVNYAKPNVNTFKKIDKSILPIVHDIVHNRKKEQRHRH